MNKNIFKNFIITVLIFTIILNYSGNILVFAADNRIYLGGDSINIASENDALRNSLSNNTKNEYVYLRDEIATVTDSELLSGPTKEHINNSNPEDDRIHYIRFSGTRGSCDAIIIESNGHYGLIDSSYRYGDRSIDSKDPAASGKEVVRYLSALGVDHLDFVLATHAHNDHMGGIPDIVAAVAGMNIINSETSSYEVQEEYIDEEGNEIVDLETKTAIDLVSPEVSHQTKEDTTGEVCLIDENTTYICKNFTYNEREESMGWGNQICYNDAEKAMEKATKLLVDEHSTGMELLGAQYNINGNDSLDDSISFAFGDYNITLYNLYSVSDYSENTNSIVTLIEKENVKTLLTGDIDVYDEIEQKLAKIIRDTKGTIDVLKIPHHGFIRSTSKEFVDQLEPRYAVLTTNLNVLASYSPFYSYLKEKNIHMYRTMDVRENAIVQDMTDDIKFMTSEIVAIPQNKLLYNYTSTYSVTRTFDRLYGVPYDENGNEVIKAKKKITETETINKVASVYQSTELSLGSEPNECVIASSARWARWYNSWDDYDIVYVNNSGDLAKGWNTIGKYTYCFDENGVLITGWKKKDGHDVYLLPEGTEGGTKGAIAVGWTKINGKWYFFDSKGKKYTGIINEKDKTYYFDNGLMLTNVIKKIDGVNHYFNKDGKLSGGFYNINNKLYFFSSDGKARKGWKTIDEKKYYSSEEGVLEIGWKNYSGSWYYFKANGEMATEWQLINGDWYYFGRNGKRYTGWNNVSGNKYLFDNSGKMITGWINNNNNWNYLGDKGLVKSSWIVDGIASYYLDEQGNMLTNQWKDHKWLRLNGVCGPEYYAEWKCNAFGWWYEDKSGWFPSCQWQKIDGKMYYFSKDGYKATNQWVDGRWLDLNGDINSKYSAKWCCDSNGWWYEDKSGWYPHDQWQKINEDWYYFSSDGYLATEQWLDGYWLDSNGHIDEDLSAEWYVNSTGWWFEYDNGWYPKNQWLRIDGEWYYFNDKGYSESI